MALVLAFDPQRKPRAATTSSGDGATSGSSLAPPSHALPDRRARLIAAAHAAASWVRARRAIWGEAPLDICHPIAELNTPGRSTTGEEQAALQCCTEAAVVDTPVDTRPPRELETATDPAPEFQMATSVEPTPISDSGLSVVARAVLRTRTLGAPIVRWLPRVAAAAILLALAATGCAYWLKTTSTPKTGVAVLESLPNGSQVLVDGNEIGTTPITTTLSAGPHRVEFRFRTRTRTVQLAVAQGGRSVEFVDWTRKPTGQLRVTSNPIGARLLVDGAARGVTPLTLDDVAVGPHVVVLEGAEGSVRRSVTVSADEATQIAETFFGGWLTVFSPFELAITEGTRAIHLDERYQVLLPPGPHELRLENRALGYQEVRRVEIQPGETTRLSVTPPQSTLSVTATAPADVWLDGVGVGQTPLIDLPVGLGTRNVVLKSAAGERRLAVAVTVKPIALNVDFSKSISR